MIPVFCSVRHDPKRGSYGDCYRACIATILGVPAEDVPHVYDSEDEDSDLQTRRMDEYLRHRGMTIFRTFMAAPSVRHLLEVLDFGNRDASARNAAKLAIVIGETGRGNHAVVVGDGRVLHNPSRLESIVGPTEGGFYVVELLCSSVIAVGRADLPAEASPPKSGRYLLGANDELIAP